MLCSCHFRTSQKIMNQQDTASRNAELKFRQHSLSGVYTSNLFSNLEFYLGQSLSLYEAKSLGKYLAQIFSFIKGRQYLAQIKFQIGHSGLSTWKYQFSYNHWSQATLSLVSTWMGDCSSVTWVLLLTLNPLRPRSFSQFRPFRPTGWKRPMEVSFLKLKNI